MQLDWNNIKTVLLDMDGTLLDLHYDTYFWLRHMPAAYAKEHKLDYAQTMAKLKPIFEKNAGTLNWYSVDFWQQVTGLDIMRLKTEVADKIGFLPFAEDFLKLCRQKQVNIVLITNGHRKVLNLKIQKTNIDQYFDTLICSHELNYPKEQQQFWHELQKTSPFDSKTTLFIDDSEAVLDSAQAYGIEHIFSIEQPDSTISESRQSKFVKLKNLTDLF